MERVIIFGDIHANLPALDAVFADMAERGYTENLYCLGDLVGYGTFPNEVIAMIRERNIPTITGNYDEGVGNNSDDCGCAYKTDEARKLGERSIAWSNAIVSDDNKAYLRGLEQHIAITVGQVDILMVHGSPRKVNEYLYEDRPEQSLIRIMDNIEASVLVCGHTHLPYDRLLSNGRRVINAGSVGKPKDDNRDACYLVLEADGDSISAEFVRVPYDVEKAALAIEATEMPDEFAQMLRDGRG